MSSPRDLLLILQRAIMYQQIHKVRLRLPLTPKKALNMLDEDDETVLTLACQKGNDEILDVILSHDGVDFNMAGKGGFTALHYLAMNGKLWAIEKMFSKAPVDIDVETATMDTPLILAAKKGHVDVIKFLVDKGANIEHCNKKNFTALLYACSNGCHDAANILIEMGANVNARNDRQITPLMKASQWGYLEVCKLLLDKGAHIDAVCNFDQTALIYATKWGNAEIVKYLLENGADVNDVGFHFIRENKITPLNNACRANLSDLVRLLLSNGAEVNFPGHYSLALMTCAEMGSEDCARLLLEAGANKNGRYMGESASEKANRQGFHNLAALLE